MTMKFLMSITSVVNVIKDSISIGILGNASLVKIMFICVMNATKLFMMKNWKTMRSTAQVVQEV